LAGIPTKVGAQYARIFVDQRIQRSMLVDLDKTTLKEMGIIAIGDQVRILHCYNMYFVSRFQL
jgi:hypothetical protein